MCSIIMIIDSILISIITSIPKGPDPLSNSMIFTVFVAFFIFSNYIFLRHHKKASTNNLEQRQGTHHLASKSIIVSQVALSSLLVLLVAQIFAFESFDLVLITYAIFISHLGAIGFLVLLTYQFVRWLTESRNYLIIAYAMAFSIIILYLITSLIFLSINVSFRDPIVEMKAIKTMMSDYSTYGTRLATLANLYTYLSIISFVAIWIPSIIILRTYSARVGSIRYWTLVCIPLIYFFFPYIGNEFGIFDNLLLEYGMQFNLLYYIMFSPYKQIGGLLFGIVFWVIASKIKRENLKIPVRIAGSGMILLFGSAVLHGLTFIVSPPFGLVTISFMSLASYMLFNGFFSAAKELSRDVLVRREIYKIAGEHSDLLGTIGRAELNKMVEKRVSGVLNKMKDEIEAPLRPELQEADYKKFIDDALRELTSSKNRHQHS
jgi:hypothetical protein